MFVVDILFLIFSLIYVFGTLIQLLLVILFIVFLSSQLFILGLFLHLGFVLNHLLRLIFDRLLRIYWSFTWGFNFNILKSLDLILRQILAMGFYLCLFALFTVLRFIIIFVILFLLSLLMNVLAFLNRINIIVFIRRLVLVSIFLLLMWDNWFIHFRMLFLLRWLRFWLFHLWFIFNLTFPFVSLLYMLQPWGILNIALVGIVFTCQLLLFLRYLFLCLLLISHLLCVLLPCLALEAWWLLVWSWGWVLLQLSLILLMIGCIILLLLACTLFLAVSLFLSLPLRLLLLKLWVPRVGGAISCSLFSRALLLLPGAVSGHLGFRHSIENIYNVILL